MLGMLAMSGWWAYDKYFGEETPADQCYDGSGKPKNGECPEPPGMGFICPDGSRYGDNHENGACPLFAFDCGDDVCEDSCMADGFVIDKEISMCVADLEYPPAPDQNGVCPHLFTRDQFGDCVPEEVGGDALPDRGGRGRGPASDGSDSGEGSGESYGPQPGSAEDADPPAAGGSGGELFGDAKEDDGPDSSPEEFEESDNGNAVSEPADGNTRNAARVDAPAGDRDPQVRARRLERADSPFADEAPAPEEPYIDDDPSTLGPYADGRTRQERAAAAGVPQADEAQPRAPEPDPSITAAIEKCKSEDTCREVNVLYGTSRVVNYDQPLETTNRFGAEPDTPFTTELSDTLNIGEISVSVPRIRKDRDKLQRPWSIDVPFVGTVIRGKLDPTKHFVLHRYGPLTRDAFSQSLNSANSAFIFVHGYDTPMKTAAMRAAQIAVDINYDGQPMIFSWPSFHAFNDIQKASDPVNYHASRRQAEASRRHFIEFIELIRNETGVETVHVVMHSMGNYLALHALADYYETMPFPEQTPFFGELIMAAPDVEANSFSVLMNRLDGMFDHETMYTSSEDIAMKISKTICIKNVMDECAARAGYTNGYPDAPIALGPTHDTIDVSRLNVWFWDISGHNYVSEKNVVDDISELIENRNHDPDERQNAIVKIGEPPEEYWVFNY